MPCTNRCPPPLEESAAVERRTCHALPRLQIECRGCGEVHRGRRFEISGNVGAQNRVPPQIIAARQVAHDRDVPVRHRGDEIPRPECRKPDGNVRPCIEAVPRQDQLMQRGFLQRLEAKMRQDLPQRPSVQHIQLHVRLAARAHLLHGRLVLVAPGVGELIPIHGMAHRLQQLLRLTRNAGSPVDEGAEHIEEKRLDLVCRHPPLRRRPLSGHAPQCSSTLPECNQHVNQGNDGESQMPKPQTRLCQQVIGRSLLGRCKAENGGETEHSATINAPAQKSVSQFTFGEFSCASQAVRMPRPEDRPLGLSNGRPEPASVPA